MTNPYRLTAKSYLDYRAYHDSSREESIVGNHPTLEVHRTCREHRNMKGNYCGSLGNA